MAGYSIILNLSGTAVDQTARLATNLALADKNATSLASSLAAVSAAARSIPARPITISSGVGRQRQTTAQTTTPTVARAPRSNRIRFAPAVERVRANSVARRRTVVPLAERRNTLTRSNLPGTRVVASQNLQQTLQNNAIVQSARTFAQRAVREQERLNRVRSGRTVRRTVSPVGTTIQRPVIQRTPPMRVVPTPRVTNVGFAPNVQRSIERLVTQRRRAVPADTRRRVLQSYVRQPVQPVGRPRVFTPRESIVSTANLMPTPNRSQMSALRTISNRYARQQAQVSRAAERQQMMATRAAEREAQRQQRRRENRRQSSLYARYGTGFNIGGFSGRLSTVLQPDENNMIMGMDAGKLMKAANVASIATSIMSSIGKALFKVVSTSTVAPIAVGGLGMLTAVRALQSESFAEGVRLISRRHQAKMGLGEDYLRAETNTDYLAGAYGLDRSTTLSAINTLTGLGIGGTDRKLNVAESTGLTKVGGLISQHHGVPFERVMTNIQQLLVQDKPNIRDIRELLNQAPILGKFALKEMEDRNIKGMDVRSYLKDQKNILSALKQYELTVATNAGMQARGQIALAQQDAWATVAGNDPFWRMVGDRGSGIIGAMANGINGLMTTLANSPEFKVMVRNIEIMFDKLGKEGDTFIGKLIALIDQIAARFGFDLGNKTEAKLENDRDSAIQEAFKNPTVLAQFRSMWEGSKLPVSNVPEMRDKEFMNWVNNDLLRFAQNDKGLREALTGQGEYKPISDYPWIQRVFMPLASQQYGFFDKQNMDISQRAVSSLPSDPTNIIYRPPVRDYGEPTSAYAAYVAPLEKFTDVGKRFIEEMTKVGTLDPSLFKSNGEATGEDLKQANRDRRSLEIHFHDKLVEWNNTVMTGTPNEVVEDIAVNLDQMVSAAIQRALLGASNKVASSWY